MKPDVRQRAVALVVRVLLELFQGPPSPLTTTLKAGGSPVAFRGKVDVPFRVCQLLRAIRRLCPSCEGRAAGGGL